MKYKKNGLISFNRFMYLFIIITRHSKEQFIKEQRKTLHKRRKAFKLKDWAAYERIVENEIDMERLKYLDVVNYCLEHFDLPNQAYKSTFMKF